ncbi:MAG: ABC transporter permease [Rubrivivax sp.]
MRAPGALRGLRALDRKLLRDLARMWSQALTIAMVVASGVGGFVATLSAVDSLEAARERFYVEGRFADLFASMKRAPLSLLPAIQALPGVAHAQASVEVMVRVQIEGVSDPIGGQLIGLDRRRPNALNLLTLRRGQARDASMSPGPAQADGALPAWVSEAFAEARGLQPGSRLQAVINGRQRALVVAGVALSPEYVFAGMFGMPDPRSFGVFWVDGEALSAAWDMEGAFNHLAIRLAPGASERHVIAALQPLIGRYGAREARAREHQASHAMLDNEIREQRVLGTVLPTIFLAVAAFLLNVVVARLVATQREQIATLKALGYANRALAAHYLKFVGVVVIAGCALGLVLGDVLGAWLMSLYAEFFRFPVVQHRLAPTLALFASSIALVTAGLGTLNAIAGAVRLAPAEAMRPPAPARFRTAFVERLAPGRVPTTVRMILRQMERRPWRTLLSVGGVAAAVAIVVMGNFFRDAIGYIVDTQFNVALRGDAMVFLQEPGPVWAGLELARLPGVAQAEPQRSVSVTLVNGHRRERSQIRGLERDAVLSRVVDRQQQPADPGQGGLVLTDRLATKLGLRVGDRVGVEVLEGRPRTLWLPLEAVVQEMMGTGALMERRALNRVLGEDDLAGAWVLAVPGSRAGNAVEAAVLEALRELPRVAGAFSKATMLHNMEEVSARNVRIMSTVLTLFASVIAVGVVYNHARIALAERTWELASLRVLGFTRAEVSALLLGEGALTIALALPVGMLAGLALVHLVTGLLKTDQFHFPVVILPRTYAWAALCVLAAGLASALVVRRHIDRLDMVAALKTRE